MQPFAAYPGPRNTGKKVYFWGKQPMIEQTLHASLEATSPSNRRHRQRVSFLALLMASLSALSVALVLLSTVDLIAGHSILGAEGADMYRRFLSMHGIFLLFGVAIPIFPCLFGPLVLPRSLGVSDLSLAALMRIGAYLYVAALFVFMLAFLNGGVAARWMLPVPEVTQLAASSPSWLCTGILLLACCYICVSISIICTFHRERKRWHEPKVHRFFAIGLYIASWLLLLGSPALVLAMIVMMLEREIASPLFSTALGGDPVIYESCYWWGTHLCTYAVFFPMLGFLTDILDRYGSVKPNLHRLLRANLGLAFIFIFSFQHHLSRSASGFTEYLGMLLTCLAVIPLGVIGFEWIRCLAGGIKGWKRFSVVACFEAVVLMGFGIGGGFVAGILGPLSHLSGTSFSQGHSHFLLGGCLVLVVLGLGFELLQDRTKTSEITPLQGLSLGALFYGANLTFLPFFFMGYMGRVASAPWLADDHRVLQVLSILGATVFLAGIGLGLLGLAEAWQRDRIKASNPRGV